MNKIQRWLHRHYLFWRYKHNYKTGRVILTTTEDRGMGLTTMMIKDCVKRGYKLYVPTLQDKRNMAEIVYKMGKQFSIKEMTIPTILEDYLLCERDLGRGIRYHNIIVDNHCTDNDLKIINNSGDCFIQNGFVYSPYVIR